MAEVIGATGVTTFANHPVQATGGERRKFLQGLRDERQVGVDLRPALPGADPGQAGLCQDAADGAAVHVQLPGDGADPPFLDVVVAQDVRFEFRGYGHAGFLRKDGEALDGAAGRCGQTLNTDGRSNGTALSPAP